MRWNLWWLLSLIPGCLMQNLSGEEKLRDAIIGLNDEARWGRMDLAIQRVHPSYRPIFVQSHAHWGESVAISESEVIGVRTTSEKKSSISTVTIRWIDHASMLSFSTTLDQNWVKVKGGYVLVGESIVGGNASLLRLPEPVETPPEQEPQNKAQP